MRIGLIVASRIARKAVVEPAAAIDGVEVVAVAARDEERARAAADAWGIPRWFASYEDLLHDNGIDAVYISTPAALHREWAVAAIASGLHVLCEKPLAANAGDAQLIHAAAQASDRVVMEAFHWRYHPLAHQIREAVQGGLLGELVRVDAPFEARSGAVPRDDIRWVSDLGGGAMMDFGCYPVNIVRFVAAASPTVATATAVCPIPELDGSMTAWLEWPSGLVGSVRASMIATAANAACDLVVTGDRGTLTVVNPVSPQRGSEAFVVTSGGRRDLAVDASSTYSHQLSAFRDAVEFGASFPTTTADGVQNMAVIDACYQAAGLLPRASRQ